MTEHPENTPVNRFFAALWAVGGVLAVGVLGLIIAGAGSAGEDGADAYEAKRAADRSAKLAAVREAESKLLAGNGEAVEGAPGNLRVPLEVATKLVLDEIGQSVPRVTAVPVPGSPAALELMEKQAAESAAGLAAEGKPAEPAAEGKPAEGKPAAAQEPGEATPVAPKKDAEATPEPAAPKKADGEKGKGQGEGQGKGQQKGKGAPKPPVTE